MERARRSSRPRKSVVAYDPLRATNDRLLRIALKRSELEFKASQSAGGAGPSSTPPVEALEEIPTIQPSHEEFNDPITLWNSLNSLGLRYGAVKLRPPEGWRPPFSLDLTSLKFTVRQQKIHRLASGEAFTFPSKLWTAQEFKQFGETFKRDYKWCSTAAKPGGTNIRGFECEYWRLVETQASPVQVFYAADVEVSETGSGFPSPQTYPKSDDDAGAVGTPTYYAHHPWNLLNLPNVDGSLLQYLGRVVPGVTCPWLYIGMLFSSFCWHTEDDYFAAVNYQHFGDAKAWYVIPPNKAPAMNRFMKDYLGHRKPADVLHSLSVQISPNLLVTHGIPVYRAVQHENEFILLWPRTYHCGFNTGFNCNEACNIAPPIWLDWGPLAAPSYRFLRSPCLPYEHVVYLAAANYRTLRRPEQIAALARAVTRLILRDYTARQDVSHLSQVPIFPSTRLLEVARQLRFAAADTSTTTCPSTMHVADMHDCLRRISETSVHLVTETQDGIAEQLDAMARLPCSDCSVCRAACYQGVICCPHTTDPLCVDCASHSKVPCGDPNCDSTILLYRFPFRVQMRLLQLLRAKAQEQQGDALVDKNSAPMPSLRTLESFERARMPGVPLGHCGPFIWKDAPPADSSVLRNSPPSSNDDAEVEAWLCMEGHETQPGDALPLPELQQRLSTREILSAARRETEEETTTTDGTSSDTDEASVGALPQRPQQKRSYDEAVKKEEDGQHDTKRARLVVPATALNTSDTAVEGQKQEILGTIQQLLAAPAPPLSSATPPQLAPVETSPVEPPDPRHVLNLLDASGDLLLQHAEDALRAEHAAKTSWEALLGVPETTDALRILVASKVQAIEAGCRELERSIALLRSCIAIKRHLGNGSLLESQVSQILESPPVFQQVLRPAIKTVISRLYPRFVSEPLTAARAAVPPTVPLAAKELLVTGNCASVLPPALPTSMASCTASLLDPHRDLSTH